MKIPIHRLNNSYVAEALVEIPDNIFNHFPVRLEDDKGWLTIEHVRSGAPTGIMGNASLIFKEEPEEESKNDFTTSKLADAIKKFRELPTEFIYTSESILLKLGFQKRGFAKWWHPLFGENLEHNWMDFDPNTDDIKHLVGKIFKEGQYQGQKKVRWDIKKALDIPLI
jgi:hypothetical protein